MDRQQEGWLILTVRLLKFSTDHPYAATGIFGAMVGSAATYLALTRTPLYEKLRQDGDTQVVTPEVYEVALPQEDLRGMLSDPTVEARFELPTISVIIKGEKQEPPKELPDIQQ